MSRWLCLVGLLAAIGTASALGAKVQHVPFLGAASQVRGHVSVTFTLGDLTLGQIEVATSPKTRPYGGFLVANVKLREVMSTRPDPATGLAHWRTHKTLPAGIYYVHVSGSETDGVTDCKPGQPSCLQHWSNVRRVAVR
jgi:hypothetical protein